MFSVNVCFLKGKTINFVFFKLIEIKLHFAHRNIFESEYLEFSAKISKLGEVDNKVQSSAYITISEWFDMAIMISFKKILNNKGPRTLPCGTPLTTKDLADALPSNETY